MKYLSFFRSNRTELRETGRTRRRRSLRPPPAEQLEQRLMLSAQVITPTNINVADSATFDVVYTALDAGGSQDNSIRTTGVSLQMHYDSSEVAPDVAAIVASAFPDATIQDQPDGADFDGDPNTDRFVNFLWFDITGQFPNSTNLPLTLFTAEFDPVNEFAGSTVVGFSGTPPVGFGFESTAAQLNFGPATSLDVDGNGTANLFTDGILIARYMAGFRGMALIDGALATDATRTSAIEIETFLADSGDTFDVDANAVTNLFTDGILIVRYLAGFRGTALTSGAIGAGATRDDATSIESHLTSLMPQSNSGTLASALNPPEAGAIEVIANPTTETGHETVTQSVDDPVTVLSVNTSDPFPSATRFAGFAGDPSVEGELRGSLETSLIDRALVELLDSVEL